MRCENCCMTPSPNCTKASEYLPRISMKWILHHLLSSEPPTTLNDVDNFGRLNSMPEETIDGQLLSVFGEFGISLFVVN